MENVLVILALIGVVVFIAALIETLVEFIFEPLFKLFPKWERFKPVQMYIAIGLGILAAYVYHFDLIYLLGQFLKEFIEKQATITIPITDFGLIITGVGIGKGSNYIHGLIQKYFVKPSQP